MRPKTFLFAMDVPPATIWQKSTRSGAAGHCVELSAVNGSVAVRHSRAPEQGALMFTKAEASAFIEGAKAGEFDHLTA